MDTYFVLVYSRTLLTMWLLIQPRSLKAVFIVDVLSLLPIKLFLNKSIFPKRKTQQLRSMLMYVLVTCIKLPSNKWETLTEWVQGCGDVGAWPSSYSRWYSLRKILRIFWLVGLGRIPLRTVGSRPEGSEATCTWPVHMAGWYRGGRSGPSARSRAGRTETFRNIPGTILKELSRIPIPAVRIR